MHRDTDSSDLKCFLGFEIRQLLVSASLKTASTCLSLCRGLSINLVPCEKSSWKLASDTKRWSSAKPVSLPATPYDGPFSQATGTPPDLWTTGSRCVTGHSTKRREDSGAGSRSSAPPLLGSAAGGEQGYRGSPFAIATAAMSKSTARAPRGLRATERGAAETRPYHGRMVVESTPHWRHALG